MATQGVQMKIQGVQNATFDENPHENERIWVILGCANSIIACAKHRCTGGWLKLCRCMFTEKYHFNIFRMKWDRNMIITVISDHLSHAQGKWPVYLLFTNLKCHSNGHVTTATTHHHVSRAAPPVLEIYLIYYQFLTHAIMPILSIGLKKNCSLA